MANSVLGTLLAGIGMILQVTQDLLDVSLQATLRFGWVTLAEFLRQFISVVLAIALVLAGAHLLGFFFVTIPAGLIALMLRAACARPVSTAPGLSSECGAAASAPDVPVWGRHRAEQR